jgi:uncharacterized protein
VPVVFALLLVLFGTLWLAQRWLIYYPEPAPPPPVLVGLPSADLVSFTTEDGLHLEGWIVRPTAPPTGRMVIIFNGNAGHRGLRAPLAAALAAYGLTCLLFDYRGYGGNPGLPSERGLTRDARAARAAVEALDGVDARRITYYGESLGAAVAVRLAVDHPPEALILRSPFTSLAEVGQRHFPFLPVRWLLRDRYETIGLIEQIHAPLLVIAGTADRIVPFEDSERLFEAAWEPKWLVTIEGADHNDEELLNGPELVGAVVRFLQGLQ